MRTPFYLISHYHIHHTTALRRLRQEYAELVFEKFRTPALFLSKDAVLACFACGKTTGLVADIGAGTTTVSPVVEGWLETKGALVSYKRVGVVVCPWWMSCFVCPSAAAMTESLPPFIRSSSGLVKSQLCGRVMDRYMLSLLTNNGITVQPFLRLRKGTAAAGAGAGAGASTVRA